MVAHESPPTRGRELKLTGRQRHTDTNVVAWIRANSISAPIHATTLSRSKGADAATRARFASDPYNLTLAPPGLSRNEKRDRDAGAWIPEENCCWFAWRIVAVRQRYGLTIDRREAEALDDVLLSCQ